MSRRTLAVAILSLSLLGAGASFAQEAQLLEAYQEFEKDRDLDALERRQEQLKLLSATLDATDTSLALVHRTALVVERAAATAMLVAPDGSFGRNLDSLSKKTATAARSLEEQWPVKGARSALAAREYKRRFDEADAEISAFLNDPNLPPDAGRGLAALRAIGMVLENLGDVPVLGAALEQYGELVATFSQTLRQNYDILARGGQEKALLNNYSKDLLRGFPGTNPIETQVLRATRWNVPLVRDADGNDAYYLKVDGAWTKVDGARISSIVSDWLVVHGQPARSLGDQAADALDQAMKRLRGHTAVVPDRAYPPPSTLLEMDEDPKRVVFGAGISRKGLREEAQARLVSLADQREMLYVLYGVPGVEEGQIDVEVYRQARKKLRELALRLGVPLSPQRERSLLRDLFVNPEVAWRALRAAALRLHPGGEDFVSGLDLDPRSMDLQALGKLLEEYRSGRSVVPVRVRVRDADGNRSVPGARVNLVRTASSEAGPRPQTGALAVRSAITDAAGEARLSVLRGHHFLSAKAVGFDAHPPDRPSDFEERRPHDASVTLTRPLVFEELLGTLLARVREHGTNAPISGAQVSLRREGQLLEAVTDPAGEARIVDIPFGRWTLAAVAEGFHGRSRSDFEVGPADPDRRGTIPLSRIEPEARPPSPPDTGAEPDPEPEPQPCGFQMMDEWNGETSTVVDRVADGSSRVAGDPGREVEVTGPGRLKVSVVASGHHEQAGDQYGWQRLKSYVIVTADPSVTEGGRVLGSGYYLGNRDRMSRTFLVRGPGAISVRFVPESCRLQKGEDDMCWVTGESGAGRKLLPMKYELKVEFDPCGK